VGEAGEVPVLCALQSNIRPSGYGQRIRRRKGSAMKQARRTVVLVTAAAVAALPAAAAAAPTPSRHPAPAVDKASIPVLDRSAVTGTTKAQMAENAKKIRPVPPGLAPHTLPMV
jgi:hypothetical protein